ncbi:hypothetical protein [Streptomyces harbinensis]
MKTLLHQGVPAAVARGFVASGWTGEEALPWARRGIDPGEARIFLALGFAVGEAEKVLADGESALAVMAGWWRAGIPLDEVAPWRAAGFTAQEAASLRAEGTDVEQAKVLRALGGGD